MTEEYDVPRRADTARHHEAEKAIAKAIQEVERMQADVRLTDAVILLGAAKDSVADYLDGVNRRRVVQTQ